MIIYANMITGRRTKLRKVVHLCRKLFYRKIKLKVNYNAKYKNDDFLDLLIHTGVTHDFSENGSKTLMMLKSKSPTARALLYHVKKLSIQEVNQIFDRCSDEIFKLAKRHVDLSKGVGLAVDTTDLPFYGQHNEHIVRTRSKGTSRVYRFATLIIVHAGYHFTIHAIPVTQLMSKTEILEKLLDYAKKKGIRVRHLLLDRAFFSTEVMNYLRDRSIKFLMPAKHTARIKALLTKVEPPAVLTYRLLNVNKKLDSSFKLAIVDDKDSHGITVTRIFATDLDDVNPENVEDLLSLYRERWSIETSYRQKGLFRTRTTSNSYPTRVWMFMFAVCLYNLWVLANILASVVLAIRLHRLIFTAKIFGFWLCSYAFDRGR